MNIVQLPERNKTIEEMAQELFYDIAQAYENKGEVAYVVDEVADSDNFVEFIDENVHDKFLNDDIRDLAIQWAYAAAEEAFVQAYKLGYESASKYKGVE